MDSNHEHPIQVCVSEQHAEVMLWFLLHQMADISVGVFTEIWNGEWLKSFDLEHSPNPTSTVEVRVGFLQARPFIPPISMAGQGQLPILGLGNSWSWWYFCSGDASYSLILHLKTERMKKNFS